MTDYILGKIVELTPTRAVIDNNGIGYGVEISLLTYSKLEGKKEATLFIQNQVNQREGTEIDYGFSDKAERELFRLIISVSGIGASSARIILSSLTPEEFRNAILSENVNTLKSIKGIGLKSAQRMILELKDKIIKGNGDVESNTIFQTPSNDIIEEASGALIMLGFSKPNINKAIQAVLKANPNSNVEQLIKSALKIL